MSLSLFYPRPMSMLSLSSSSSLYMHVVSLSLRGLLSPSSPPSRHQDNTISSMAITHCSLHFSLSSSSSCRLSSSCLSNSTYMNTSKLLQREDIDSSFLHRVGRRKILFLDHFSLHLLVQCHVLCCWYR